MTLSRKLMPPLLCALALAAGCDNPPPAKQGTADNSAASAPAAEPATASAQCDTADNALKAMKADPLFQSAYVDVDEWRDTPVRHRYVHGGFEGTETRFSFYLPPKEQYDGRFFQYITPVPINENLSQGATGSEDKIGFAISSGAYFIETNGGGMKAMMEDSTIGAYRANAAVAQYSRVVATEMYGCERPYGYAFGGSGGGFRTIGGMENTEGVWDGAVPFVIGSPMAMPNVFTVRMYALRVLKDKLPAIADAVDVGSNTDVADLLTAEEYKVFEEVTRMGFPRSAWYIHDKLDLHGYASLFPGVVAADPGYFEDFWSKPGYEGHQPPQSLKDAIVEHPTTIKQVVYAKDAEALGLKDAILGTENKGLADDAWKAMVHGGGPDAPVALQLASMPGKDLLGADLIINSGDAAKGKLLITRFGGDFVLVGNGGDTLAKLKAGDQVTLNNRNFLASQTYHRHQVPAEGYPVYDYLRDGSGKPLYPQRPFLLAPQFVKGASGSVPSGKFAGKMIVLSNLHDTEAYPWQGDWYLQAAKGHLGAEADNRIRLWYTDNSPHGDVAELSEPTHLVSYLGVLQQALRDVSNWVEKGVEPPANSHYQVVDGQVQVPTSAAERKGIQPVINLLANGAARAEVKVGEPVALTATIEVPEGTGKLVRAEWDFDGQGKFADTADLGGQGGSTVNLTSNRSFDKAGTYFVTLRATSERNGNAETAFALVHNLGRVRVVVKE